VPSRERNVEGHDVQLRLTRRNHVQREPHDLGVFRGHRDHDFLRLGVTLGRRGDAGEHGNENERGEREQLVDLHAGNLRVRR
jgi:hypothetical protein